VSSSRLTNWLLLVVVTTVAVGTAYFAFPYVRERLRKSTAERVQQQQVQQAESIAYVYDRRVGWRLNGNTQVHRANPNFGYDTRVRTNAEGFIDRDHFLQSPFYRIAMIGDSFVEAEQVPETSRFSNLIEDLVPALSEKKLAVEVMNFGISNYGPAHAYGVIRNFALKYHPNEVWLFLSGGYDLPHSFPLETPAPLGPYYLYSSKNPEQLEDILFGYPKPPELLKAEMAERYGEIRKTYRSFAEVFPYFYSDAHHPAMDLVLKQNVQCFDLILRTLGPDIRFRIIYLPALIEIRQDMWTQFQQDAIRSGVKAQLTRQAGERKIADIAKRLNIQFTSLVDELAKANANHQVFGDHLTPLGHRDVAVPLTEVILKEAKAVAPGPNAHATDNPPERH